MGIGMSKKRPSSHNPQGRSAKPQDIMAILRKGTSGEPVKRLQAKLGVETDGEFGSNTEKALKEWQTKK
jgi:murein L,D-transpeptidase YcbB/YkuD